MRIPLIVHGINTSPLLKANESDNYRALLFALIEFTVPLFETVHATNSVRRNRR